MPTTQELIEEYKSRGKTIRRYSKSKRGKMQLKPPVAPPSTIGWDYGQKDDPNAHDRFRAVTDNDYSRRDQRFFFSR